jgi:hypothetical protein
MKDLPVSRFVPEELSGGAARKAAKMKNACEPAKYLALLVFAVEETKKIQSAVYAELEGTRSCRRSKKPRRAVKCQPEISVVQATDKYERVAGIACVGEGNWWRNMRES